jgi:predicted negative regulator of RcsB-dependent stress response
MAEEYLTDDEQVEHVKRLAGEYGPWMLGALVIGVAFTVGLRYYEHHRNERALQAAEQFGEMASALQHDDRASTRRIAEDLITAHPASPYADQAKLMLARLDVDEGQIAKAIAPLTEVMNDSKDTELRHIARLRLARLLIDQGKPDDALKTLADQPGAFAARYHEVRGDAFLAKKDFRQAQNEYKAALENDPASQADSALLTLKIADLGLAAAQASPPATAKASGSADTSNKAKP